MADFNIQRGVVEIASGATTATITAGVDYTAPADASKAFVRITATEIGNPFTGPTPINGASDDWLTLVDISSISTSVTFTRTDSTVDANRRPRIYWELIEYIGAPGGPNEFVVRGSGTTVINNAAATATTSTISGVVSDADIVPIITGANIATGSFSTAFHAAVAEWDSGADAITFRRGMTTYDCTIGWVAVEFVGSAWSVQFKEHAVSAAGTTTATLDSAVTVDKAFMFIQKRIAGSRTFTNSISALVWLSGSNEVSFSTDANFATNTITYRVWVVSNPNISVQRISDSQVTRSGEYTVSISAATPSSASVMEESSVYDRSTDFAAPINIVGWRISSSTQLTGYQRNSTAATTITSRLAVVSWPTATASSARFRPYFITG